MNHRLSNLLGSLIRSWSVLSLASILLLPALAQSQSAPPMAAFQNPPADTRPGCYWYWINDNISKAGITKDLEAMARVGIGRAYIGQIYNAGARGETPVGTVKFMSPAWWEAMQWAVKEGDRCGVEIGFFNSPGWSQSGGPWVKPNQSMRYLAASETVVEGGRRVEQLLPVPEIKTFPSSGGMKPLPTGPKFTAKDFQDVRVVAFRQPETEAADLDMKRVKVSSPTLKDVNALIDGAAETSVTIPAKKIQQHIDFVLDEPVAVQSLRLDPLDFGYVLTCEVAASDDGKTFRKLTRHVEERGHQGPRNKDPILIPFPETKAKHLRVTISTSKPVAFSGMAFSRRAGLANYVRKQLGETSPSVRPPWDAYVWPGQAKSAAGSALNSAEMVDLSDKMDAAGRLTWDAPPGKWVVLRAGMIPTGTQCAPASPESRGLEVDKMNRDHVRSLFDGMVGEFLRRTPPAERKALKYVIADSYETGPQNWTDGFVEKFTKHYGYSPVRFLPCLTGRVVDSPEVSTRFLWDWRRLVAESIAYDYVGGLRDVAHENNLTLWLENYGHWGFPSEFLLYGSQSDQIGGEFWESGDPADEVECRAAASAAHIYGRADVYAEAFTSNRSFRQSPASLKNWCDWVYGAGINHLILHVYIHQPDERQPGIIQWFGTSFNRHNTWFEQSKAFVDYTRRSAVLLKAGRPVIDVAYYIGESAPAMRGPRAPALPDGYDFDYINSDALINRATVANGKIVITNGPTYAVLVLPPANEMRPEVVRAIQRLVRAGATVVGHKPTVSPSLAGYPACDKIVADCANEIWGDVDGIHTKARQYGQGTIHNGVTLNEVLAGLHQSPDVSVTAKEPLLCAAAGDGKISIGKQGGIVFKHRSAPGCEIYFLANTTEKPVEFTASLRVSGRKPSFWNADTGAIFGADAFTQKDGRTLVPLKLAASESIFVVLDEPISREVQGKAASNTPGTEVLATLAGPWTVRFNGQGAAAQMIFDQLTDWAQHTNAAVRNYAGTAVYEINFSMPDAVGGRRTVLELGNAAVIATVEVNGQVAGTAWTAPWTVDITKQVKLGQNQLRIKVANGWNNRLVADAKLPPAERLSYVSQPYTDKNQETLQSGGLLGPVKMVRFRE